MKNSRRLKRMSRNRMTVPKMNIGGWESPALASRAEMISPLPKRTARVERMKTIRLIMEKLLVSRWVRFRLFGIFDLRFLSARELVGLEREMLPLVRYLLATHLPLL